MLDPSYLEISWESFVDQRLAVHQSDLLIRTRYRDSPLLAYILVEHKSYPDRWTVLQLLRYMVRIWEKELARNKKLKRLPPIIPMIFYHGSRHWKLPLSFSAYLEFKKDLQDYIPDFQVMLFDLRQFPDVDIDGADLFRAAVKTLKYAFTRMKPHLGEILTDAATLAMDYRNRAFLEVLLEYILQVGRDIQSRDVEQEIQERAHADAMREVYMTVAEKLRAEGKEIGKREGKREGKQEGKREGQILDKQQVLVRLLEKKFGALDAAAEHKIRASRDAGKLDRAIDHLLDAESIDQVLRHLD